MSKKPNTAPAELKDASRGVRLHKAMADAGVGARRTCEQLIAERRVQVNGWTVVEMPVFVNPAEDVIEVDGRRIARQRGRTRRIYLMVNKPRGVICTNSDPEGRKRIIDLVPHGERLFCVGRLDADSSGLVLLTNDGEMAEHLTHPRYGVAKTYRVGIKGRLETDDVERLKRGFYLADEKTGKTAKASAESVRLLTRDLDRSNLEITLTEGRNREIRRILVRLGHPVKRLRRIALGPLRLKGVASGDWRELTRQEVQALRATVSGRRPGGQKKPRTRQRPARPAGSKKPTGSRRGAGRSPSRGRD